MSEETRIQRRPPAFLTLVGLLTIAGMVAMPYLAGPPDAEKVPDLVRFLGRFHPLVLHLPIGIVSLALFLEILRILPKNRALGGAGSLVLGLGAISAVVAVLAGFLLFQGSAAGSYDAEILGRHLWGGIIFASGMIVTFLAKAWTDAAGGGNWLYRVLLFGNTAVMGLASHDGGSLTHGPTYLTEFAPAPVRKMLKLPEKEKKGDAPAKPLEDQLVFNDIVAPMLESRCTNCHNEAKIKGKLRLDSYEFIVKGGKGGPAVVPGDLAKSSLFHLASLPEEDDERMPPDGKPGLNADQLAVIKWWIETGADPKKTVAELAPTDDLKAVLAKLTPAGGGRAIASHDASKDGGEESPHAPAATASAPDPALKSQVEGYAKEFPGALTFESQQSPLLTFTAVSLRANLDDARFEKLTPVVKHLVTADLSATKVTDKSVALLSGAENLRMVRLAETGITDGAIESLVKLQKLESLNLYGTGVTDAGVQKLASLPNLKRIYLWQTKVTPAAIDELKKKLPKCEIITGAT